MVFVILISSLPNFVVSSAIFLKNFEASTFSDDLDLTICLFSLGAIIGACYFSFKLLMKSNKASKVSIETDKFNAKNQEFQTIFAGYRRNNKLNHMFLLILLIRAAIFSVLLVALVDYPIISYDI